MYICIYIYNVSVDSGQLLDEFPCDGDCTARYPHTAVSHSSQTKIPSADRHVGTLDGTRFHNPPCF